MPSSPPHRDVLLHQMAQFLMRMVEATTVAAGIDALVGLLQSLTIAWYTIDVFAEGRLHKHVASFRCPRSFPAFVTRLGFVKRPDGMYQGSFADSTLLLVKAGGSAPGTDCLVCAIGLPKSSPLNDGAVNACLGGLMHDALSHVWWFERHAYRQAALDAIVEQDGDVISVFDAKGNPVEQHAPRGFGPFPPSLFVAAAEAARRRSKTAQPGAITVGDEVYQTRWIKTERPFENRYLVLRAKRRRSAPIEVVKRLKPYGLSRRESQVAELVFSGKTNRCIAGTLLISMDTVKTHCRHIFSKLGISRRTEFLHVIAATSPAADAATSVDRG